MSTDFLSRLELINVSGYRGWFCSDQIHTLPELHLHVGLGIGCVPVALLATEYRSRNNKKRYFSEVQLTPKSRSLDIRSNMVTVTKTVNNKHRSAIIIW
jgi:hypothetical protein